ncbi:hypothetical protein ANK1_2813 [plant metagenome]|uniref:Uncharacterized protein n=1 Tax=plant metagenome TaxID=1297885 RepID=A0A484QS17_9ZZZZ
MESVLQHFLYQAGQKDAAAALHSAINDTPTPEEIARHPQLFEAVKD